MLWVLEGVAPMFGRRPNRLRHDAANIALGIINALMTALVFAAATRWVANWAAGRKFGLLSLLDGPAWARWAAAIILFDLWMYAWHVANHKAPLLWRFHQVHHADGELDASSALRFHTGEIALSSVARLAVVPLLGMTVEQLLVYEMILQPVILLHHSNVRFPPAVDYALRWLIVTPRIHWVHHSKIRRETDSNYSSIFSLWDRLFRTLRWHDPRTIELGLEYTGEPETRDLGKMLALPLHQPPRAPDGACDDSPGRKAGVPDAPRDQCPDRGE